MVQQEWINNMLFDKKQTCFPTNYDETMKQCKPMISFNFHDEEERMAIEWLMPQLYFLRMEVLVYDWKRNCYAEIISIDFTLDLNEFYGLDWLKDYLIKTWNGGLSNPFLVRVFECLDMSVEAWDFPILATGI